MRREVLSDFDAKDYGTKNKKAAILKEMNGQYYPSISSTYPRSSKDPLKLAAKNFVMGGGSRVYNDDIASFLGQFYSPKDIKHMEEEGELLDVYSDLYADATSKIVRG